MGILQVSYRFFLLFLLLVFLPGLSPAAVRSYYVVFGGHLPANPVFLMQIDANGTVLREPRVVLKRGQFGKESGAAAIAHFNGSKLHLWRWGKDRFLYHALIDKSTLTTEHVEKVDTFSAVDSDTLQVSQRKSDNILLFEGSHNQLQAILLSRNGLPSGLSWDVVPGAEKQNDEGCLSSDGRVVITNRHDAMAPSDRNDHILWQSLTTSGIPTGAFRRVASAQDIEACDVSNANRKGQRWVVFVIDHGTDPEDILVLQKITRRGKALGKRILINAPPRRNQDDQNIAIDPRRRFVLFTLDGVDYGCSGKDVLVYQRLTSTGRPGGPLKLLTGCDVLSGSVVNIDLLID